MWKWHFCFRFVSRSALPDLHNRSATAISRLVQPKPTLNGCRNGYFYFRRYIYIRYGYCYRTGFYGGTSAFLYVWSRDHGGRFCATDVARKGVRTSLRAAGTKSDSLAGLRRPTLRCGFSSIIYFCTANQNGVIKRTQIGKWTHKLATSCNYTHRTAQPNGAIQPTIRGSCTAIRQLPKQFWYQLIYRLKYFI